MATSGAERIKTAGEAWDIVHAAATDHANSIMRAAGRKRWSAADSDAYVERLYQLLAAFGFWGDDAPTPLYFAMRADRSAPFIVAEA